MKTPFGKECSFFFGDYFRGRNKEECRLLIDNNLEWEQDLCKTCQMPGIQQANGCENMVFTPTIFRPMLVFKKQIKLQAYCRKSESIVKVPEIGCGECNPILELFMVNENDNDSSD